MGRRKIEIKPIRDDRNRSVTFLKRKGGLFKKAHELSVLCSVDVAVIIFGHNKKLYEYSSGEINDIIGRFQYYGGAHEHKGPQDFADKRGGDDEDDDDEGGDEADERGTPQPDYSRMNPQMQHHPGFQHVRQGTPSGSPPMHNGAIPQFQRGPSPLPHNMSRPSSRAAQHPQHVRRTSANVGPQAGQQQQQQQQPGPPPPPPPPPQPNYAYTPNPPFYNPPPGAQMPRPPPGVGGQSATYPPPSYPAHTAPPPHAQMQQAYMQDARRPIPPGPSYTPPQAEMNRHPSQEHLQPPGAQAYSSPQPPHSRPTPSPQPPQPQQFTSPPIPQPKPLPANAKSSIFTPIDDSRSLLAQHWGTTNVDAPPRSDGTGRPEPSAVAGAARSQSIDIGAVKREKDERVNGKATPSPPSNRTTATTSSRTPSKLGSSRTGSAPSVGPPSRSSTNQSEAKRPRLKVQIPSEHSGDEGGLSGSAPDDLSTSHTATTGHGPGQPSHGVVLPPPSPSAGALMSAGAQGPPNPFARPAPPMNTNPHAASREAGNNNTTGNNIETPISALPSRFMNDSLLPSPSTFFPEWGFGRSADSNMLHSPLNLNLQTPVAPNGSGWRDEERKRSGEELEGGETKKAKT